MAYTERNSTAEGRAVWEANLLLSQHRWRRFLEWLESEGGVHYGMTRKELADMLGQNEHSVKLMFRRMTELGIIKIESGGTRGNSIVVPSRYLLRMTWAQYWEHRDEIEVAAKKARRLAKARVSDKARRDRKKRRDEMTQQVSKIVYDAPAEVAAQELLALADAGADMDDDEIAAWS